MFGIKKKFTSNELPDLPIDNAAPSMDDYRHPQSDLPMDADDDIHGLPSFPDSPMSRGFSQSMIKSAVETPDFKEDLPEIPGEEEEPATKQPKRIELQEWTPSLPPAAQSSFAPAQMRMPASRIMPKMQTQKQLRQQQHSIAKQQEMELNRPVFIKLDKFKDARESLEAITEKVGHLDELLRMIKEVKAKENAEIEQWEQEIEKIKTRIGSVNSELFENATR